MDNVNCNIINDLLPLYIDDVVSDESRLMVEKHLETCPECRGIMDMMQSSIEYEKDVDVTPFKRLRRKLIWRGIGISLLAALILLVVGVPFLQKLKPITNVGEQYIEQMQVAFLEDGVYIRREGISNQGVVIPVDQGNGVVKFCIGRSVLDFWGFGRAGGVNYSQIASYSKMLDKDSVKEVDYCDGDGNVLYVLWEKDK